MRRHGAIVIIGFVVVILSYVGCEDMGSEAPPTSVIAVEATGLAPSPNDTTQATLSGAVPPYTIISKPDSTIAKASINGSILHIIGVAIGSTTVIVGDAAALQNKATISLTVETPVSFANQIQPIFNSNGCTGCHGGSGGLVLTAGQSHSNLANVQAQAGCTDKKRVQPRDPANSVLYLRVVGRCKDRMPQGGNAIATSDLESIRKWIAQGARNN